MLADKIHIFKDADELANVLAADFQSSINQAAKISRQFNVALSGGSTPALLFQKLASTPYRDNISWQNIHFFWGDERCVPPEHPDSNFGMTKKNLLDYISIPNANIHRIVGENDPAAEAMRYAQEIKNVLGQQNRAFPQFDWILLGMGTDGHTASIFPGSNVLDEQENICAIATHPESGQQRITLTLPVINNAKRVSFLVTGENKASVVAKVLTEDESLLSSFVRPVNGILEWYLDRSAVALI